jgi:hypothetical protein
MNPLLLSGLFEIGKGLIDKLLPDPEAKAKAQLDLLVMQQNGELKELETRMSAILAEANSPDPWTSRARPSFLYVIYVMVLMAIPMGVLSAFRPDMAGAIAAGMQAWLAAIPEDLYVLFGVGYVGYAGARTFEKRKGAVK